MKEHGNIWRAASYFALMTYATAWSYGAIRENPDNKLGIAFVFIAAIVAATALYLAMSRKD